MVRILVLAWLGAQLAGCAPELNWRELRFDEAGVGQLFPCKPQRQQRRVMLDGQTRLLALAVCDAAGASWALAHLQARAPAEVPRLIPALVRAAQRNLNATASDPLPVAQPPLPGTSAHAAAGRYRIHGRAPDGRALRADLLIYARGLAIVQLTVLGPDPADPITQQAVSGFLGSARVLP